MSLSGGYEEVNWPAMGMKQNRIDDTAPDTIAGLFARKDNQLSRFTTHKASVQGPVPLRPLASWFDDIVTQTQK